MVISPSTATAPPPLPAAYAALCNPPRRAKRAVVNVVAVEHDQHRNEHRSEHDDRHRDVDPPVRPPMQTEHAALLTAPTDAQAHAFDAPTGMDAQTPAPKRRGRKPGALSRSARESQRKMNHSRIEKARRLKINDALAALRELVPHDFDRPAHEDDNGIGEGSSATGKGKKDEKEREFKLEVLERAVAYLRFLTQKLDESSSSSSHTNPNSNSSSNAKCASCGSSMTTGPSPAKANKRRLEQGEVETVSSKRKRASEPAHEVELEDGDEEDELSEEDEGEGEGSDDENESMSLSVQATSAVAPPTTIAPQVLLGHHHSPYLHPHHPHPHHHDDHPHKPPHAPAHAHASPSQPSARLPSIATLLNTNDDQYQYQYQSQSQSHYQYHSGSPNWGYHNPHHSPSIPSHSQNRRPSTSLTTSAHSTSPSHLPSPPLSGRALTSASAQMAHAHPRGPLPNLSLPPPRRSSVSGLSTSTTTRSSTSPRMHASPYLLPADGHAHGHPAKQHQRNQNQQGQPYAIPISPLLTGIPRLPSSYATSTSTSTPSWTYEDETAASVLLRISSTSSIGSNSNSASGSGKSSTTSPPASAQSPTIQRLGREQRGEKREQREQHVIQIPSMPGQTSTHAPTPAKETPSSLLGIVNASSA